MSVVNRDTARTRRLWDRMAGKYDRQMSWWERVLFGEGREWVCSRAQGAVLEIAVGTGRNLPIYPVGTAVAAIELSPEMLTIARERAREAGVAADLSEGDAQHLDFPDGSFDTVVCTLALCSIPDDSAAVGEAFRVLRPGGRFLLLEHVGSPNPVVRAVQWLLEQITIRLEGDNLTREPLRHLRKAGFEIETLERLKLGIVERVVARKPA